MRSNLTHALDPGEHCGELGRGAACHHGIDCDLEQNAEEGMSSLFGITVQPPYTLLHAAVAYLLDSDAAVARWAFAKDLRSRGEWGQTVTKRTANRVRDMRLGQPHGFVVNPGMLILVRA